MLHRERLDRPEHIYPADEWRMVEKRFYPRYLAQTETFFATSNGYLGMRGTFEEGRPFFQNGTFVNGFYESWPIIYGEEAYGFAKTGQTIVNITDARIIRLFVDDEPFFLPTANLLKFERVLDMRAGTLEREVLWETSTGKRVSIRSRRIVSFRHRHLAAIFYEVTLLDTAAPVILSSELVTPQCHAAEGGDPRGTRGFGGRVLLPKVHSGNNRRLMLGYVTKSSGMAMACGADHLLETDCPHSHRTGCSEDHGSVEYSVEARPGAPIRLTKFITYHTSQAAPVEELCEQAGRSLERASSEGFDPLCAGQKSYLDDFWHRSDIRVSGDPAAQQAIRFNLFHLLQASARADGVGIPAKGLTGQGYEGHYFWDTEIYVLPFLIYTSPQIAKNLLKFRHSILDRARERARAVNNRGALFPWRTISGEEASAYYAAGTAQYHINADIMYALKKYVDVTCDVDFLHGPGAEMLVETARLWADLGFYSERKGGKFCIQGVTGPDEYNTVVDNNTYTNLMARENLWYAASTMRTLREKNPDRFAALVHDTGLEVPEIEAWQKAADLMYVPIDKTGHFHLQDDQFLNRKPWDFENTPDDKYPLLLHHHPLVIYRHQVIKQADVVLAMFLLGHEFSLEQKRCNFDYYDALTTGDSSLSVSVQAIIAAELGYGEKAREYARYALLMDLADVAGNVKDGCHIASMGGTWMAIVYGLGGFRDYEGRFSFIPKKPVRLKRVCFRLTLRGQLLEVDNSIDRVAYRLLEGDGVTIWHHDEEIRLTRQESICERPHAGSGKSGGRKR